MLFFKPYTKEEITIFKTVKQYFEKLPPIANDEYENAFYDLVAQYGSGGENYSNIEFMFSNIIKAQTEIAYENLSVSAKKEIKEMYENHFISKDFYDPDLEEYIYDTTDLSLAISDRFKAWAYDTFDENYLSEVFEEEEIYKDEYENKEIYPSNISKQIINGFIKSELKLFKTYFEEEMVPGIQDDRSLSIAWLSYYFKEAITHENASAIINFVEEVHVRDDYNVHVWYRISALQAAAFILTSDIRFANYLLQHIGCGQGWARGFIVQSAGIICPLLSFENHYLRRAVELNLKYGQIYEKESVILYLNTQGDSKEKINWLEQQIKISDKDRHIEFLSKLKEANRYYKSGFFVKAFSNAKSYFIFKMLSEPLFTKVEPELFDDVLLNYEELNSKEESHPLNSQYIDLSFLREK